MMQRQANKTQLAGVCAAIWAAQSRTGLAGALQQVSAGQQPSRQHFFETFRARQVPARLRT